MGKKRMKSRQNIVKEYVSAWEDSEADMCYDRCKERDEEYRLEKFREALADLDVRLQRQALYFGQNRQCYAHKEYCCKQCLKWVEREQSAREEFPDTSSW